MFGEETQDVEVLPQAIPDFVTLRSSLGKPGNGDVFGVGSLLEFVCVHVQGYFFQGEESKELT